LKTKILLITTHNLASNPRLVKELGTLLDSGFDVCVICFQFDNWSNEMDIQLKEKFREAKFISILGGRNPFMPWLKSVFFEKMYRLVSVFFKLDIANLSQALSRRSNMIIKAIEKVEHADLVIGHNPGAMYPSWYAAKKFGAKAIFDFEDYHRGEQTKTDKITKYITKIESRCIPLFDSITSASPAITEAYLSIFPEKSITTINNVFPISYAIDAIKVLPAKPLKLFWFSQYIGKKRGLENLIKALGCFKKDEIKLTLLGSCSPELENYFSSIAESSGLADDQLIFHEPVSENKLVEIASQHHIGIASEISHMPNRDLCLTNKIFIYLLSGNALMISNTKAQKEFIESHPGIGMIYEQDYIVDMQRILSIYLENPELLNQHRIKSLQLAKNELNWELESVKWLKLINQLTG
jgi:glycosyltransferase involved in cell wall biosynthesis